MVNGGPDLVPRCRADEFAGRNVIMNKNKNFDVLIFKGDKYSVFEGDFASVN